MTLKNMKARKYLKRYQELEWKIEALEKEKTLINEEDPRQQEIDHELITCRNGRVEIFNDIQMLKAEQAKALTEVYVNGKNIKEVAAELHYSYQYTSRLQNEGLRGITKILAEREKKS